MTGVYAIEKLDECPLIDIVLVSTLPYDSSINVLTRAVLEHEDDLVDSALDM